jgi:hypothetical protein
MRSARIPAFFIVVWLATTSVLNAVPLRTVALSGTPAPGHPNGVLFSTFDAPVVNDQGEVAFRANGAVLDPNTGIWSEGGGQGLRLVARRGQMISHPTGVDTFRGFGLPFLNDSGVVAFEATGIAGGQGGSPMIIIEDDSNQINVVARINWPAPMASDQAPFRGFDLDDFNDQGEAVFEGLLAAESDRDSGVWITTAERNARLVARTGDQAPDMPPGVTIRSISNQDHSRFLLPLTNSGRTSFITNEYEAAWIGSSYADLRKLFTEGDPVPGVGEPALFSEIRQPLLSDDGEVTFSASFGVPGIGSELDHAVFRGSLETGFRVVVRSGDHAPGFSSNVVFHQIELNAVNSIGDTLILGHAANTTPGAPSTVGLWIEDHGLSLQLVTRAGMPMPGLNPGEWFSGPRSPLLNDLGQTLFQGEVSGPGVNESNNEAVWLRHRNGAIELILREGQLIDVKNGPGTDFRTISNLRFDRNSFNVYGQLAFRSTFSDGTQGLFVTAVTIPEPESWVIFLSCVLALVMSRYAKTDRTLMRS